MNELFWFIFSFTSIFYLANEQNFKNESFVLKHVGMCFQPFYRCHAISKKKSLFLYGQKTTFAPKETYALAYAEA